MENWRWEWNVTNCCSAIQKGLNMPQHHTIPTRTCSVFPWPVAMFWRHVAPCSCHVLSPSATGEQHNGHLTSACDGAACLCRMEENWDKFLLLAMLLPWKRMCSADYMGKDLRKWGWAGGESTHRNKHKDKTWIKQSSLHKKLATCPKGAARSKHISLRV